MAKSSLLLCLAMFLGCGGSDSGGEVPQADSGSGDTRADTVSLDSSADSSTDSGTDVLGETAEDTTPDTFDAGTTDTGATKDSGAETSGDCPPTTPKGGTACAPEGLKCSYGAFTTCFCTTGKWECAV